MHWFVCLLHLLELPLKKMLKQLDGDTKSKVEYGGLIGQVLKRENFNFLALTQFEPVEAFGLPTFRAKHSKIYDKLCQLESENITELEINSDQTMLYQWSLAISSGTVPPKLATIKIGQVSTCRWCNTATRLIRLYACGGADLPAKSKDLLLKNYLFYSNDLCSHVFYY